MPYATKQTQTIAMANEILAFAGQLQALSLQADSLFQRYVNIGAQATLQAMPTCVLNADGSLGAADATPTASNPIDPRVAIGLNRATSATDLIGVKNVTDALISFMGNAAVTTLDRNLKVDKVIGG